MPWRRPIAAIAARSTSFSIGLVGVSTQISRVSGRIAASTASGSAMSTSVSVRPAERSRTWRNSRTVPPYRSSVPITCAP
jgi:hypothetical protein